jgi:two-component SAPR family response regulator
MNRFSYKLILIGILLNICSFFLLVAQDLKYGLEFRSFDVTQEKRTSLNLTPEKALKLDKGFTLSFDMYCADIDKFSYGYVFRLIGNRGQHIDFIVNVEKLQVINSEGKILANCLLETISGFQNTFFNFALSLDIQNNQLQISIAGYTYVSKITNLSDFSAVCLIFGKSDYPNLQTSDVPKVIIKDIRIADNKGKVLYYWKLFKHTKSGDVCDELRNHHAKAENPKWLVDEHAFWKKRTTLQTEINPQIAFNSNHNMIAIADPTVFRIYDTKTHSIRKSLETKDLPHSQHANQIVYNPMDNQYYSYCFDSINGKHITAFDTINNRWNNDGVREVNIEFWHHNKFVSQKDSSLYVFCGYGHHRYKNRVNQYSFSEKQWKELHLSGDVISPRYLSGLGVIDDDRILIFGGYGSEQGLQELVPRYYYDLYLVDLRTKESKKLYELPRQKDNFLVANSLVVDTLENCFYALCFPQNMFDSQLSLVKFSLDKPQFKVVSDSIPFQFRDITSYADLFLNKETKELIAVTFSSKIEDSVTVVPIYSLLYPPVAETDLFQTFSKEKEQSPILYIAIASCFVVCIGYFSFKIKKQRKKTFQSVLLEKKELEAQAKPTRKRETKQAVYFFGGFQVWDKQGKDLTGDFPRLLKQLFIIVLFNTLKEDSKGISSVKLKDTFWYDKSDENARNNRGVSFCKIRQNFEQVGFINIEGVNSYWTMQLGEEIRCDYKEALLLMQQLKYKPGRTKEEIMKLVEIVSFGELLPNVQVEWLDSFKADFANKLIDILLDVGSQKNIRLSPQEMISIANAILIHDVLNEDALRMKCFALVKMGKNGLAKVAYNAFIKEYTASFGSKFKYSFKQLIG